MGCDNSKDMVRPIDGGDNPINYMNAVPTDYDIDLNDPEVQKAATKIQASFRGHKIRKDIETKKDSPQDKAPATADEEDVAAIDLTDPDLANAALKIQAGFRGHIARKQVKTVDDVTKDMAAHSIKEPEEEDIDIDLTDPEVNKAAIKIQSTFRGHMTRKTNQ